NLPATSLYSSRTNPRRMGAQRRDRISEAHDEPDTLTVPSQFMPILPLTLAAVGLLLILILVVRLHAALALLITSIALGLAAGMNPPAVLVSMQKGFGEALGFIAVVLGLGAIIGVFLESSGGGRVLADWLLAKFGRERAIWAVLLASFLVGMPLF